MNKELDRLINPVLQKTLHDFDKNMKIAALSFLDSPAYRSMERAIQVNQSALFSLNNLTHIKNVRELLDSTKLSSLLTVQSGSMRFLNEIDEINRLALLSLPNMEYMNRVREVVGASQMALWDIHDSPVFKSALTASTVVKNISITDPAIMQAMNFINTLPSFQKLANMENSPFTHVDLSSFDVDDELNYDEEVSDFLIKIDHQICEEVNANTDFNALSDKTKNLIIEIFKYFFAPLLIGILLLAIEKNWDEITALLPEFSTAAEVKKYSRNPDSKLDRELLKSYRIINRHNVNLRDEPGMNAEVIMSLSMGKLVNVIDKPKTHKAWLLVEVKIDGQVEQGWIARRYTEYFK
jgi:hypothetical protein